MKQGARECSLRLSRAFLEKGASTPSELFDNNYRILWGYATLTLSTEKLIEIRCNCVSFNLLQPSLNRKVQPASTACNGTEPSAARNAA